MTTTTHLWETSNGRKVPITLLGDDHLKSAYKLCWLVVHFYERLNRGTSVVPESATGLHSLAAKFMKIIDPKERNVAIATILKERWGISISIEIATRFSVLFEEEIKKRGRKFQRPDPNKLSSYLKQREDSKDFLYGRFTQIMNTEKY